MESVYLSGPISSPIPGLTRGELKDRFWHLRKWLKRNYGNWSVINPVDTKPECDGKCLARGGTDVDNEHTWECWLKWDLIEMLKCDSICLLPGGDQSRGALLEREVAQRVGMNVYFALLDDEEGWVIA